MSHSRLTRRSRSPSSSQRSRSSGRRSHRSHVPSRSSHVSGGCSCSPSMLSRHTWVVPLAHVWRRVTPSATVSRVLPSPPPMFVTPLAPLPPPYTSRSGSVSRAPPCQLLPLFPLMTPPPRYVLLSPTTVIMFPQSFPCPSSQSTPRLPAPVAGNLTFQSPPSAVRAPVFIDRWSLSVGWLLAMPSASPECQESPSVDLLGREGLVTLGDSAAGESPRTHPPDHDVEGKSCLLQLLRRLS